MQEYNTYSFEEKKAFITGVLSEIKKDDEKLNDLYHYFLLNENVTEAECDEVYSAIADNNQ